MRFSPRRGQVDLLGGKLLLQWCQKLLPVDLFLDDHQGLLTLGLDMFLEMLVRCLSEEIDIVDFVAAHGLRPFRHSSSKYNRRQRV